jgi:hypothetical protein
LRQRRHADKLPPVHLLSYAELRHTLPELLNFSYCAAALPQRQYCGAYHV